MDNRNTIFVVIAILIVGGIIIFFMDSDRQTVIRDGGNDTPDEVNEDRDEDNNQDTNDDTDNSLNVNYEMYSNSQVGVQILKPINATASAGSDRSVKIQLLGENNRAGTEVTDGLTLTIFKDPESTNYSSLRTYGEARLEKNSTEGIVSGLEERTVNGMRSFRYTYKSIIGGNVTEYVFLGNNGGYTVSFSVSGASSQTYRTIAFTMLESINFAGYQSGNDKTSIKVAMLDYKDIGNESSGKERGCDRVVFVSRDVDKTTAPLRASLEELFSIDSETVNGWNNFIAKTNDTLSFERATISNGVASIFLTGELSGLAGVCDDPRASIQIEETALQFNSVNEVHIYLNGERTDLRPDSRGQE